MPGLRGRPPEGGWRIISFQEECATGVVHPGTRILLDDGIVMLEVAEVVEDGKAEVKSIENVGVGQGQTQIVACR